MLNIFKHKKQGYEKQVQSSAGCSAFSSKRLLSFFAFLMAFQHLSAQVVSGRVGVFRDSIYLNGVWYKSMNTDTSKILKYSSRVNSIPIFAGNDSLSYTNINFVPGTFPFYVFGDSLNKYIYSFNVSDYLEKGVVNILTQYGLSGIGISANSNNSPPYFFILKGAGSGARIFNGNAYTLPVLYLPDSVPRLGVRITVNVDSTLTVGGGGHFYGGLRVDQAFFGGGDFWLTGGKIFLNGSAGTTGQVLTSQGAGTPPIWTNISSRAWSLTGNAGTTAGTNFIGTTDSVDMVFKTKNIENMRITATGNVGIGTTTPAQKLDVNGSIRFTGSLMPQGDAGAVGSVLTSNGNVPGFFPIWSLPFYLNEPAYQTVTTIISDGATIPTNYNVAICKFNATTPNVNLPNTSTSLNNSYGGRLRIVVYNFTNDTLTVNPNGNLINGGSVGYSIPVGTGKTFQWSGDSTIGWMVY